MNMQQTLTAKSTKHGKRYRVAPLIFVIAAFAPFEQAEAAAPICVLPADVEYNDCLSAQDPVAACAEVLRQAPENFAARASLCEAYAQNGEYDSAIDTLSEADKVHRDDEPTMEHIQSMVSGVNDAREQNPGLTQEIDELLAESAPGTTEPAEPTTKPEKPFRELALWNQCLNLEERGADVNEAIDVCERAVEAARDEYEAALVARTLERLRTRHSATLELQACENAANRLSLAQLPSDQETAGDEAPSEEAPADEAPNVEVSVTQARDDDDTEKAFEICRSIKAFLLSPNEIERLRNVMAALESHDSPVGCDQPDDVSNGSTDACVEALAQSPPSSDEPQIEENADSPPGQLVREDQFSEVKERCLNFVAVTLSEARSACVEFLEYDPGDRLVVETLNRVDSLIALRRNEPLLLSQGSEAITY